jgi:hypothetical protein
MGQCVSVYVNFLVAVGIEFLQKDIRFIMRHGSFSSILLLFILH